MGPLAGIKLLEMKGIGPGPYAGMLLADMGAEVIVVERSNSSSSIAAPSKSDPNSRGKKSIALNLKSPEGLATLLKLIEQVDGIFEGFRPGVAERLGFGPDECLKRNPKIVFGRMTGWGQTGPLANSAGHDINYISLTGSLAAIGDSKKPIPPLNLVGDYAGGSMFLVMGMLAAIIHAQKTGEGQVIDTAITDGSASLMSMFHGMDNLGVWNTDRGSNLLDGAAHFYDVYETLDGKFVSIGSIEPQFYAELIEKANLDPERFAEQLNPAKWPELKATLIDVFKNKTREQWCEIMEGTDICFAPVLDYREAPHHPHNQARETYIDVGGVVQPAPAPRFSSSALEKPVAGSSEGADTESVLSRFGFQSAEIEALKAAGAIPSS